MLSRETRIICGVTLFTVPTIFYGGLALLGLLTSGIAGVKFDGLVLDETQHDLFRAGHAHAGVLVTFALVLQILLDSASLSSQSKWISRVASIIGATSIPGAFFGMAFFPEFRFLLYVGIVSMAIAVVVAGFGLVRK